MDDRWKPKASDRKRQVPMVVSGTDSSQSHGGDPGMHFILGFPPVTAADGQEKKKGGMASSRSFAEESTRARHSVSHELSISTAHGQTGKWPEIKEERLSSAEVSFYRHRRPPLQDPSSINSTPTPQTGSPVSAAASLVTLPPRSLPDMTNEQFQLQLDYLKGESSAILVQLATLRSTYQSYVNQSTPFPSVTWASNLARQEAEIHKEMLSGYDDLVTQTRNLERKVEELERLILHHQQQSS
ncbi:hypothetical protein DM01DRAFT_1405778 [Hesseltinella vesiculosa]|uniref:Uncharacterized protein n=1 Tax=Hesseltinella vesiculosa TaxID=101127 RepID=A0A1X2GNY2_9FUNG|nr:hypothetical protein DM01DRAFT_1405778 [Hesseltinella vesiculosa]